MTRVKTPVKNTMPHQHPSERLKPRNNGIFDYMRSAKLSRFDIDETIYTPNTISHNRTMTVAECETLIRKAVDAWKAHPTKIRKDQALAMLHARNEAAKREGKPTYDNVKDFLKARPVLPAAR